MVDEAKQAAAGRAADGIESGMVVGLGTGSTATLFVRALGEKVRAGLRITGIPTSEAIARLAEREGIPLTTLEKSPRIDVDVDGADAIDPALNLLKGLGGALLREKIVAAASARFVVVAGEDKLVKRLTESPKVPVEVVPFGWSRARVELEQLGASVARRARNADAPDDPFITDGGHYLLDCTFREINDALGARIKSVVGVVDHGLFIGMAHEALIGRRDGSVEVLKPKR